MLVIRLARGGRNKYPTYRIVAAEKRFTPTGRYVEVLGRYNPHTKELVMDKEGIERRVSQGAQPSNTVLRLMVREGIELPKWAKLAEKNRKPKKEPEVTEQEAADEAGADTVEVAQEVSDAAEAKAVDAKTDAGETTEADASAQEAAADAAEAAEKA